MKDTLRKLALFTLSACLTFPAVAAYNPRTVTLKARSESMAAADEDFAGDIVVPEDEKVTFRITHNSNVNIDIQVRGDDYFQQSVGDAGSILFSLFCKYVPYTDILENTVEIFDAINQFTTSAAITSAGQGAFRAHYKRISINGEDDDGQLEEVRVPGNNSLHSGTFEKEVDIQKDPINVDVGDYAAIYVDASTIFQQCSEGYWDFWGISKPPDLHAEVFFERFTKGDAEPYFHVYRR